MNDEERIDKDLEIIALRGEISWLKERHDEQIDWWAAELDFWRSKFLREHPELDNWEYVRRAREEESES